MSPPDVQTPQCEWGADTQTKHDDAIIYAQPDERKELARLTANACRSGFVVHELARGFLIAKWGHAKEVPSLHALAIALRQMGVQA